MRHRKHNVRFGRQRAHYKATMRHLVSGLIINKSISTTKVKAKEASRLAERLVTIAKDNTVAGRRRVYSILCNRDLVTILFNEIAPLFKDRNGGYTRVMLTGNRHGDNARMAILEFVERPEKDVLPKKKRKIKKVSPEEPKAKIGKEDAPGERAKPQKEEIVQKKEEPEREIKRPPAPLKKPEKHGFLKRFFRRKREM